MNEIHTNQEEEALNKQMIKDAIVASALIHGVQSGISSRFLGRTISLKIVPKNKYAPCLCGSGEKYKFCCGRNQNEARQKERIKEGIKEKDKQEVFTDGKTSLPL